MGGTVDMCEHLNFYLRGCLYIGSVFYPIIMTRPPFPIELPEFLKLRVPRPKSVLVCLVFLILKDTLKPEYDLI